ncbi:hypothetical protein MODO_0708 [Myroides odoratimimus]|nr:hypothetical protein MODO_0708 [Myroides odoratimimus]
MVLNSSIALLKLKPFKSLNRNKYNDSKASLKRKKINFYFCTT